MLSSRLGARELDARPTARAAPRRDGIESLHGADPGRRATAHAALGRRGSPVHSSSSDASHADPVPLIVRTATPVLERCSVSSCSRSATPTRPRSTASPTTPSRLAALVHAVSPLGRRERRREEGHTHPPALVASPLKKHSSSSPSSPRPSGSSARPRSPVLPVKPARGAKVTKGARELGLSREQVVGMVKAVAAGVAALGRRRGVADPGRRASGDADQDGAGKGTRGWSLYRPGPAARTNKVSPAPAEPRKPRKLRVRRSVSPFARRARGGEGGDSPTWERRLLPTTSDRVRIDDQETQGTAQDS